MAIIYSYPIVDPTLNDLVLGTDVDAQGKPTKNFTIQSIIDLVTVSGNDLQAVLDNGNAATQNIVLTGNISATQYTDGTMSIVGGTATGFSSVTSTDFDGDLTGVVKNGSSIQGNVTGVTQPVGTSNTKLATTAFVMNKVDASVLQYLGDSTGPFDLNLVTDDFKISGTANQIETTATTVGSNIGTINLKFPTTGVTLPDGSIATTQATSDDSTKVATTAFVKAQNDELDLDFTGDTGTSSVLLNSQTLDFEGTANKVTTTVSAQKVKFSLPTNVTIGGIFTGTTFSGDLNGTINTATTGTTQTAGDDSTKIATTEYVDNAAGSKTLDYAGDATGPFSLNLTDDDLEFNGDSNITVTAAAVAANKGIVTIDLNNDVTISGTLEAGTLSDGTFSGTAGTYTGGVSITSTDFVGALTGNASTATALASSGAISLSGDTVSTGGPHTYTSGGAVTIPTTIADTTVTAKVLTNLPTPTSSAIAATDTILAAMGKLQGQIDGLAGSLSFEGTWNANTDTPTLSGTTPANGVFYIVSVAGNTDLDGITDWQVGDWAIYVDNGAGTDAWQKLDQSNEVLGSGAANKIAKWTSTNTLATGLIEDDGTDVTVGNSGNLVVEGNTTLGDTDTDSTTVKGPAVFEETSRFNVGISLGDTTYGTAGQVLTSGGGAASVNTWTTPTTGTVTSVAASIDGDSLNISGSPITSSGTLTFAFQGSDTQYIDGAGDLTTFPTVDNYQYWTLSDGTNTTNITSTGTATFSGGTYITASESAGTLTIDHDATTRADTTSSDAPAFGGTFDAVTSVTSNATGHVTAIDVSTVTIPANPVFVGPADASTDGVAGIVPAPGQATFNGGYFLRQDATWAIPPNDDGVTAVNANAPISSSGGDTPTISHDNSGVTAGTYDIVTVDQKGHVTGGSNNPRPQKTCSKSLTLANSWQPMFALSATFGGIISSIFVNKQIATLSGTQALSAHVATCGVSGTWNGSADSQTATTIVYNKIIDTANGELEVRFVSYNPSNNKTGYKCEARVLTTQGTVDITVDYSNGSTYGTTFVDLT